MFILFLMLPLIEIAGFIQIGGEIGIGLSLLWVIASTITGFVLLGTMGTHTIKKAKKSVDADIYPFEEMFDGFCILIGAALLIFPGFISDFLAVPLLVPSLRRWIFRFLKSQHNSVLDNLGKNAQGFTSWYYEKKSDESSSTTIEGTFKRIEDDRDQK